MPRVLAAVMAVLAACASVAATTSAQETQDCGDHSEAQTADARTTSSDDCPPDSDPPQPEPEPEPAPPPEPPRSEQPPPQSADPPTSSGDAPPPASPPPAATTETPPPQGLEPARPPESRRRPTTRGPASRDRRRSRARARSKRRVALRRLARQRRLGPDRMGRELVASRRLSGRPLPDPLPPGRRLDARFARRLERIAAAEGAGWALVLAVLRERGRTGSAPAGAGTLRSLADRLAQYRRRSYPIERVEALAAYNRAVGLRGLVRGLHAAKRELIGRVLRSRRIALYPGGRSDVAAGRVDVRVLVLMLYLAERHGQIAVTSLISGHSLLTASGGLSLHPLGRAVDISSVGGVPVTGHQEPGGMTERALRAILLLPAELQPSELISLFELGGPSFALADHADHIHVGF